ncbi:MAG: ASPIC/UnbV domain-containing protein [Thermoanaerobaculia bacterium]
MQQEIGLGDAGAIEALVVRWPGSGTVQTFEDVAMRRIYRVIEGEDEIAIWLPVLELGPNAGDSTHPSPRHAHP